jgi:hypothetical protein
VNRAVEFAATLLEVGQVLQVLPRVESLRRRQRPRSLLQQLRQQGARAPKRNAAGRRQLRRAIAWVDGCLRGGNCFRRALLEVALDRGAAQDPLLMGFSFSNEKLSGHAWLADESTTPAAYDFTLRM